MRAVLNRLGLDLGHPELIVTVAKGFDAGPDGHDVQLLPATIIEFTTAPVVAVGGPSKANEVARGTPTAVVFGSHNAEALAFARMVFATPVYRIEPTDDITGLEVAAAMKNAYAIALGIATAWKSGPACHTTIFARPSFPGPLPKWEPWPACLAVVPKLYPGWLALETCR